MPNNTADLKKFAATARRQLREQVAGRLEQVLRTDSAELRERESALKELRDQIAQTSKKDVVERVAYTWFNRFCALRFMDVNQYTRMGVVSPAEGLTQPEILQEAKGGYIDEALTGFVDAQQVYGLLNGQRPSAEPQQEAYRLLLRAICNSYNAAMPFMFEKIADYTELLMPLDLLSEHSILHELREALTSDACQDVEVIGWLYQYYISERKDEVFEALKQNQKIEAADIPAATQLFTPHWIVRYLVENSLGRLWILNHPESRLREKMEYYIESKDEVGSQKDEENRSTFSLHPSDFILLNSPEEIKLADPACGSGHILTYAFDLLYAIYEESGYTAADIPRLILQHNLYGIEIDPRAGALAAFALTMKAHARDRRFLTRDVQPSICVLKNVTFTPQELDEYSHAMGRDLFTAPLLKMLKQFEQAENFGALIRPTLTDPTFARVLLENRGVGGNLFLYGVHQRVLEVLQYAEFLAPRYHVVVANPPYMGSGGMNDIVREFAQDFYPDSKADLYAMFIERNLELVIKSGFVGIITMQNWMFLLSFERLRENLLQNQTLITMAHLGVKAFDTLNSKVVSTTAFVLLNAFRDNHEGVYQRIIDGKNEKEKDELLKMSISSGAFSDNKLVYRATARDLANLPGSLIAYWINNTVRELFSKNSLGELAKPRQGLKTGNNDHFLKFWFEVQENSIALSQNKDNKKWFPCNKGGDFRKWYGNLLFVLNWQNNGYEIINYFDETGRQRSRPQNIEYFFKEGITWNSVSTNLFGMRYSQDIMAFESSGSCCFPPKDYLLPILGIGNSKIGNYFLSFLSPTMTFSEGGIAKIPILDKDTLFKIDTSTLNQCISIARRDWDEFEIAWDYQLSPILEYRKQVTYLEKAYCNLREQRKNMLMEMQKLEQENNRIFIEAYGLQDELTPEVPLNEITLTCNPRYRYGGNRSDEELESMLRADTMKEFISYAVGCMFGRYSLEKPGLVLANAGETIDGFRLTISDCGVAWEDVRFKPDEDNIIPVLDGEWFSDDITERFKKFLRVTFGDEHYEENLAFIEAAIGRDVRSYFVKEFYKEHIQMYKKRPIYWMFSSAKGTFSVLIYMHRYQPDTISVILNRYLREFRAKLEARKAYMEHVSISGAASAQEKTSALKEIEKRNAMLEELRVYEREVLYPLATQRIEIDLDDGVKVNYGKFGSALVKIVGL